AFPAALRISGIQSRPGHSTGRIVALNTLGGIAGSALTGLVLVPYFGLIPTLSGLAIAASVIGLIAAFRGSQTLPASRRAACAISGAAVLLAVFTPTDQLARHLPGARAGSIAFYKEGKGSTVAVVEQHAGGQPFHRLYIQGVSNTGDTLPSLRYMRLQALLPLIIHNGSPRSALVIGFGTGITAGALLAYPELDRRVCAELLPPVVEAAPLFRGNYGSAADGRLQIRLRDGRRELQLNSETYDLITLEPPPPAAAGVANLYSSDFYSLAARRLRPQGLLAQWLPLRTQNLDDSRALVQSFLKVFPYASLWTTELHEMLLIGSAQPMVLDAPTIEKRFAHPSVQSALAEVGIPTTTALMATYVTGRDGLVSFAGTTPPVTDDRPTIEYASWVRTDEFLRVLPLLLSLRAKPAFSGSITAEAALAIEAERSRLLRFYEAGLLAYRGERDAWARTISDVLQEDSQNPYYRFFFRGSR
ncbi:MAG: fused MFS/spermidine synthase, partial [Acidobacteria bacterium]|nr:fused MFS/spermidine synthase [Acidobacteriota bacterium]